MPVCTGCSNNTLERLVLAVAEYSGVTRELMMPGSPASRRVPSHFFKKRGEQSNLFIPTQDQPRTVEDAQEYKPYYHPCTRLATHVAAPLIVSYWLHMMMQSKSAYSYQALHLGILVPLRIRLGDSQWTTKTL